MKEKIITIIPSLYEGGAEKFAADLSVHLSREFDHTTVLYNRTSEKYEHSGKLIEMDIRQRKSSISRLMRQLRIVRMLRKIKFKEQPKLAISHMLMANMLNVLSRKSEVTVCVLHGEWSVKTGRSGLLKRFVKKQYAKADLIISVSSYIKEMFDAYYRLDVPHKVIHVGLPISEIEEKGSLATDISLPEKYLVYVAGFRPVKNHIKILEQLECFLKTRDYSLVLVGDGPLRGEIEQQIENRGLGDTVILLGNLTNPYPVIKNAKVSLMVSSSESFSLVVVESMALGVPVIATDCGGPREILAPNWNAESQLPLESAFGTLIPNPSEWVDDSLTKQLDALLENESKWNSFSEKGRERAADFSIEHTEKKYEQVIYNLLANKG